MARAAVQGDSCEAPVDGHGSPDRHTGEQIQRDSGARPKPCLLVGQPLVVGGVAAGLARSCSRVTIGLLGLRHEPATSSEKKSWRVTSA